MCGIGGYFGGTHTPQQLEELQQSLKHRGPDGNGLWRDPQGYAGLVHARLAILGLGPTGAQPMSTEDGRFHLVFNGEIYNHRELREQLMRQGYRFSGRSDTEVLLALLADRGISAVSCLAGMFAFALYDSVEQTGYLARDAFGIKPLYYAADDNGLVFASELRPLCRVLRVPRRLNPGAVRNYLLWGSVPEPETLVSGVLSLPAGAILKWKPSEVCVERWFELSAETKEFSGDPVSFTRECLTESVTRHLESDVPAGLFLSGGIDSTAVLALTRKVMGDDAAIATFSIGFDEEEFDESTLAARTAAHFGTDHHCWKMTPEDGAEEIEGYLAAMDQPTIDGFNTWCVSGMARRAGIKVVLSGLGGDEVFGGYGSFSRLPRLRAIHRGLHWLGRICGHLPESLSQGSRWARFSSYLSRQDTWKSAYHVQRGIFTEREADLLTHTVCGRSPDPVQWDDPVPLPNDARDIVSLLELSLYMRNQLLRDSDVFSMAHGLELRVPFVDARLIRSLWTLPAHIRMRGQKGLLVDAVSEIPDWVSKQPKKGFRFPFQQWLEGNFREVLQEASQISPVRLSAWYRKWAVAALLHSIRSLKLS